MGEHPYSFGNNRLEERSAVVWFNEIDRLPLHRGGLFSFVLVQCNNNRDDQSDQRYNQRTEHHH